MLSDTCTITKLQWLSGHGFGTKVVLAAGCYIK